MSEQCPNPNGRIRSQRASAASCLLVIAAVGMAAMAASEPPSGGKSANKAAFEVINHRMTNSAARTF